MAISWYHLSICCAEIDIVPGDSHVGAMPLLGMTLPVRLFQETLTDLRMAEMAPFSKRETWAWEIPKLPATSIWVLPS